MRPSIVSSRFKYSGRTWPLFGKNFEGVIGGVFNGVGGFAFGVNLAPALCFAGRSFDSMQNIIIRVFFNFFFHFH